jgi:anti-sigma B factor antagonist
MQKQNPSAPLDGVGAGADTSTHAGSSARFMVEVEPGSRIVVVALSGELDLETAPELARELATIDETQLERLVIDLGGVTFMDSTGLSSIVAAHRFAESNGHTLALRRGSKQVQRLFELTGVGERLTFEGA